MTDVLRSLRTSRAARPVGFSLSIVIGLGALLVVLADSRLIEYDNLLYFIGENLLVVGGILGIVFTVLTRWQTPTEDPAQESAERREALAMTPIAAGGIALFLLARNQGSVTVYDAAISILIAVSMVLGLHPADSGTHDEAAKWTPSGVRSAYALIAAILALTGILMLIAAPNDVLTYILMPLAVFVMPGLTLTLALPEEDTPIYVHLALIPVLSLTSQMILVAWMLWLRLPITAFSLLATCVVISGIGVGGSIYRRRRTWFNPS